MRSRRASRPSNPLLVASAAVVRAIDPTKPSRITVIRLLGDALHALKESQLTVDAIRLRSSSISSRENPQPLNRIRLEADSRFRVAHERGARSLFSACVATLLKLPCRGGPLRRRAIDIIQIAGRAAGPAVAMQEIDRVRVHISGLKKLSWSESEAADFEMSCAVLTLADLADCLIAGRDVAREAILFLLSQRVRSKCRRNDLAHAIAHITQSFPPHAPPDDRLVDNVLEFCFSSASLKQGSAGFGTALLTAVIVPFMVSRGPSPADEIVAKSAKALRISPTPTERSMWGLALVRASVTARRSTTYQLHKYGTSDMTSKFPRKASNGGPVKFMNDATIANISAWVSNEIFEESLSQVAKTTALSEGKSDATIAVAGVLRMWALALPDTLPIIIPRTLGKLLVKNPTVNEVSALVDAVWLGVLKHLKPSVSSRVIENLLPSLEEHGLALAASLHICADLLNAHGRQVIRESGLTLEYGHITTTLIKRALESVEATMSTVRFGSVRVISSIIESLPRTSSKFLTSILQNLRIADLNLATKDVVRTKAVNTGTNTRLDTGEPEVSSLLGNAAALAMLIEKISTKSCTVPSALLRQCVIDSFALLRPHQAREEYDPYDAATSTMRRRAGWGLVAAMARGKMRNVFEGDSLNELLSLWKEDLGFARHKSSNAGLSSSSLQHYPTSPIWDYSEDTITSSFEEVIARSSTRSSALLALVCAMRNASSSPLMSCAESLLRSCATRIICALTHQVPASDGSAQCPTARVSFAVDQISVSDPTRKKYLGHVVKMLTVEAVYLVQCIPFAPPCGESGELCYNVCIGLVEEAQRVLGEGDNAHNIDSLHTYGSSQKSTLESALANNTLSLHRVSGDVCTPSWPQARNGKNSDGPWARDSAQSAQKDNEWSWVFGKHGMDIPLAEQTLSDAARGVAAVISQNLSESSSLIESLSSAKVSPTFSAVVALEMAKRMSHAHLAEVNRVLAVLQLLTRNALGIPWGCQRSISSQSKAGRLYTPNCHGDGIVLTTREIPGIQLQQITKSGSWLSWTRRVTDEGNIARTPFQNFHTRAFAIMIATRAIAAEAHRELSVTGGAPIWIGMMRKVLSLVRNNMASSTPTQSVLLSSAISTLGALLEVIPEKQTHPKGKSKALRGDIAYGTGAALDDISTEAVSVLTASIEEGKTDVQAVASLALSSCSHRVASWSERILAAILRAWSEDKGEFRSLGHFGRCHDEADVWSLCFLHIWSDMGIREMGNRTRFYCRDSHGIGSASYFFLTGAAAVLSSCKLHWWPLSEASYSTMKEMSAELLQWHGETSERACTAGLYGMNALWAAKIDSAQAKQLTAVSTRSPGFPNRLSGEAQDLQDAPIVSVEDFTLKESSRKASPVGPFLDEVLYSALAPPEEMEGLPEMQAAACAAVSELFRGAGVEAVSANLPRLPETLFAALDKGVSEAKRLLEILVRKDAALRPRYWFGLCRAICQGSDRLNYGQQRTTWDLSMATKSFSVYIASESIRYSLDSCCCLVEKDHTASFESAGQHHCAYSFIRKIFDFVKQACKGEGFDFQGSRDSCRLVRHIISRFQQHRIRAPSSEGLLKEFQEVWTTCIPILHKLVTDQVPSDVLHAAAEAICEGLILGLRLQRKSSAAFLLSSPDSVFSFLESGSVTVLKDRFKYLDQGEEVGSHALLCVLATCGRLLSTLRVSLEGSSKVLEERMTDPEVPERLLFSICGDFVSTLHSNGINMLAKHGGSLTTRVVEESKLQASLFTFVTPIVLGSVSCLESGREGSTIEEEGDFWENADSPGVRMSRYRRAHEGVIVSALVWLLLHDHGDEFARTDVSSYIIQCREAFEKLCKTNVESYRLTREAFVSFCNWDLDEFLSFAADLSSDEELLISRRQLLVDIILSVMITLANNDVEDVEDIDIERLAKALGVLSSLLAGNTDMSSRELQSAKVLGVLLRLIEEDGGSVLTVTEVVPTLCELTTSSIMQSSHLRQRADVLFASFKSICVSGLGVRLEPKARLGAALCAAMCTTSLCSEQKFLTEFLVPLCVSSEKLDADDAAFGILLGVDGVEDVLVSLVSSLSSRTRVQECEMIVWLVTKLGSQAIDDMRGDSSPALRCAVAAILMDGPCAQVINNLGMIVYTALLSRAVRSLPIPASAGAQSSSQMSGEPYVLSLLQEDLNCLESPVSSLQKRERDHILEFMSTQNSYAP